MDLVLSRDIPQLMEQFPHEGHFKTGVTEKMIRALPPPPGMLALPAPGASAAPTSNTGDLYADSEVQAPSGGGSLRVGAAATAAASATAAALPRAPPQLTMRGMAPPDPWAAAPPAAPPSDPWAAEPAAPDWAVPPAEKAKYDLVFATLSPSGGKVGGAAVRPVLERSNLPVDTLRRVWQLSDVDKDGQLDADEFALAMHLVRLNVGGQALPDALPADLVPPSKRAGAAGVAELE